MTPHDVLMELQTSRTAPVAAIQTALDAREEMLPVFLGELERASHMDCGELPYAGAYAIMLEILGEWADPRAYLPVAKFLRLEEDTLDYLLGDSVTESAGRVIAAVATSDLAPVFDIVLDRKASLFVRTEMIHALLRIAFMTPPRRPAIVEFIEAFISRAEPGVDPYLVSEWAMAVALLGLGHMVPAARATFTDARRQQSWYSAEEFEDDVLVGENDPNGSWYLSTQQKSGSFDTVREVSQWYCYSDDYIRQAGQEMENSTEFPFLWVEPDTANPFRHVGRNDPCPCGSGRKFENCCRV